MKYFIVVGSKRGLVLQVLIALHAFTDAVCAVVSSKETRFVRYSALCSKFLEIGFLEDDDERFVRFVNQCSAVMPGLVLVPADCDGARITSRVRCQLNAEVVPAPDAAMIASFDDKWRFFHFCKAHGMNVPPTMFIGAKENFDFASAASELGVPMVIKPVNEAGAIGIHVISSEKDYQRKILYRDTYRHGPLIAQRYIEGMDVGVNLLSVNGKVTALAVQQRKYPQNEAARIRFLSNNYLENAAYTIASESKYNGVMNIDARIEAGTGTVFLLESNPRFWRSLLASAWCGLNFAGECVLSLQQSERMRTLTQGDADIFYHPLFRPRLWRYVVFDQGQQGRIARFMMFDLCTLGASTKALLTASTMRRPPRPTMLPDRRPVKTKAT